MNRIYRPTPPVRPYSVHGRHVGMGQACPSLAQLTGTYDPNDPCQASTIPTDFTNPSAVIYPGAAVPGGDTFAGATPITVGQWQAAVAAGTTLPTTAAPNSLATWMSQNQTMILIAMAAVVGLMVFVGPPRR